MVEHRRIHMELSLHLRERSKRNWVCRRAMQSVAFPWMGKTSQWMGRSWKMER
jgi:hypothetical protein